MTFVRFQPKTFKKYARKVVKFLVGEEKLSNPQASGALGIPPKIWARFISTVCCLTFFRVDFSGIKHQIPKGKFSLLNGPWVYHVIICTPTRKPLKETMAVCWWLNQPIQKILVKLDHLPR